MLNANLGAMKTTVISVMEKNSGGNSVDDPGKCFCGKRGKKLSCVRLNGEIIMFTKTKKVQGEVSVQGHESGD